MKSKTSSFSYDLGMVLNEEEPSIHAQSKVLHIYKLTNAHKNVLNHIWKRVYKHIESLID